MALEHAIRSERAGAPNLTAKREVTMRHSGRLQPSRAEAKAARAVVALAALFLAGSAGLPGAHAQSSGKCTVTGDKVASPASIRLGDTVQVRLTLRADCPDAEFRAADIVLTVDQSYSMVNNGKLRAAQDAAKRFVDKTDLALQRVSLVTFYERGEVAVGLTSDAQALFRAIDTIPIRAGTNVMDAIDVGQQELVANGRPGARPVIVLITDGSPNQPSTNPQGSAIRSANAAKAAGTMIITIGLGSGADEDLLKRIASDPSSYYYSPQGSDLDAIYDSIALVVAGAALRDVAVEDDLPTNVELIAGTDAPAATVAGRRLTWLANGLPQDGLTWEYELRPTAIGTYPTNVRAEATFAESDGVRRTFGFPVPVITVRDPNESRTCGARDVWNVTVHSFPDTVGISSAGPPRGCNLAFDGGDWIVGTTYRIPDLNYELTDATGVKVLFKGTSVPGPGRVDQRLFISVCQPPPYRLRLLTGELNGYALCPNGPVEREITLRDFNPRVYQRTQVSYGFVRE